jgi:hypothetical protein
MLEITPKSDQASTLEGLWQIKRLPFRKKELLQLSHVGVQTQILSKVSQKHRLI